MFCNVTEQPPCASYRVSTLWTCSVYPQYNDSKVDYLCPRSGQGQNQLLCGENNLLIAVLETCIIELITSHLDSLLFILPRFAVLKVHKSETMGGKKSALSLCFYLSFMPWIQKTLWLCVTYTNRDNSQPPARGADLHISAVLLFSRAGVHVRAFFQLKWNQWTVELLDELFNFF